MNLQSHLSSAVFSFSGWFPSERPAQKDSPQEVPLIKEPLITPELEAIATNPIPNYPPFMINPDRFRANFRTADNRPSFDLGECCELFDHLFKRDMMRNLVDDYIKELPVSYAVSKVISGLAVSRFGLGTCGELAAAAAEKCIKNHSVIVVFSGNPKNKQDNHCFLILDTLEADRHFEKFLKLQPFLKELFQNLPKSSLIIDPYYQFVGNSQSLKFKSIKLFNLVFQNEQPLKVEFYHTLEKNSSEFKEVISLKANECFEKFKTSIPSVINSESRFYSNFMLIGKTLVSILNCLSPLPYKNTWRFDKTNIRLCGAYSNEQRPLIIRKLQTHNIESYSAPTEDDTKSWVVINKDQFTRCFFSEITSQEKRD